MICRTCGTDIADAALICYRCGEATSEPRVQPSPRRQRGSRAPAAIGLVLLLIAGLYMGRVASDGAPGPVAWVLLGLAVAALVWRFVGR